MAKVNDTARKKEIHVTIGPCTERVATEIMIEIESLLRLHNVGGVFDEKEWSTALVEPVKKHACQRCGSDEWKWCDYRGCSVCYDGSK